jgi:hypothetical protein
MPLLLLSACISERSDGTGMTLGTNATPTVLVRLCPGALVTAVYVARIKNDTLSNKPAWEIKSANGRHLNTFPIGQTPEGFRATKPLAAALSPGVEYGASVDTTVSSSGGAATFEVQKLRHVTVFSSDGRFFSTTNEMSVSEFAKGDCRE